MWIIRPVVATDVDALFDLAEKLGPGMTTFPANRDTLAQKVDATIASFKGQASPEDAQYLMALEETESRTLLGVSAVYPRIGHPFGFFSYHVDRLVNHSVPIGFNLDCTVLNLSNAYTGLTEIGTLAVHPDLRQSGARGPFSRPRTLYADGRLSASFCRPSDRRNARLAGCTRAKPLLEIGRASCRERVLMPV